jgi:hypothetical protein
VEEEILLLSFDLDEPETLIRESGDCAFFLHNDVVVHLITIKCRN